MRKLQLLLAMLLLTMSVLAQQKMVTGSVVNKATRQPIPDVSVQAPSRAVMTDRNGKFSIQAAPGDNLTFTHVGMAAQTVRVGLDIQAIDIVMEDTAGSINEVIVVGYKTERKRDITGAVSVVNVGEATKESNINIFTSLQGRVPGVTINNDGTPGGTGTTVLIRGFSTTGSTGPLYVIETVNSFLITKNRSIGIMV
jgi:outer membrane receptor for Fe3+-dicitrate